MSHPGIMRGVGVRQALHSFGLEKFAGPYNEIEHMVARGIPRMNLPPRTMTAIADHYRTALGPYVEGRGSVYTPFYGEGKVPAQYFARDPAKPGLQPPAVRGYLEYHADPGRGIRRGTVLAPDMQPFRNSRRMDPPRAPFVMPTSGVGTYPPADLPRYSELLKKPVEHLDLLRHIHEQAPIDAHMLQKYPGLDEIARRYNLAVRL